MITKLTSKNKFDCAGTRNYTFILMALVCFFNPLPAQAGDVQISLSTDKAAYAGAEPVNFTISFSEPADGQLLLIGCKHLNTVVHRDSLYPGSETTVNWQWLAPENDFRGYLFEFCLKNQDQISATATIGVDVSSDWKKFPRYGFLSKFPYLSTNNIQSLLGNLNRYHINGLQYYDWHYKHHLPLKGTPGNPASTWMDIANRTIYFSTVERYIKVARNYNMKSMAYNLLYGAYGDAETDGVSNQWRLFKDRSHSMPDKHDLPDSWASDIYLIDPSNGQWKNYIFNKMRDGLEALDFDGWHIDQLGDRGSLYNYNGESVVLKNTFPSFLEQAKGALDCPLVMNAVNQYGQQGIAGSPMDFLYTEVWYPNDSYAQLANIIVDNKRYSDGRLATVLAAYVNKGLSGQSGYFNTPAVLLSDAVIFASGGAHLELGEHMLANEYFPNDNLKMTGALKQQLIHYYDFLVAYQNLLRDGGSFNSQTLKTGSTVSLKSWLSKGSVWYFSKLVDDRQVFHLLNFRDATTLNWRDDQGIQAEPDTLFELPLEFYSEKEVKQIWLASPDFKQGIAQNLVFSQYSNTVRFNIPQLKYWDMIVVEYDGETALEPGPERLPVKKQLINNFPNPFNPETRFTYQLEEAGRVRLDIFNSRGRFVASIINKRQSPGNHSITWRPQASIASGVYYYRFVLNDRPLTCGKMLYLK